MSNLKTFGGIPEKYANPATAEIVLIPVPYDGTSTWQKGANKGPEAFLEAAENMELYDIETNSEVYKRGINLVEPLSNLTSPEAMVKAVYEETKKYLKNKKFVTLFGGEHSISIGAIRAFNEAFNNLTVLHIDAHADLRKEYDGSPYNHACAVNEAFHNTNLIQVGIRSMDISETHTINYDKVFFAHQMLEDSDWMEDAIDMMSNKVYITFDLDALDPSILEATGTPEPGGLMWYETIEFLRKVMESKEVVGFDIVELCPNNSSKSSEFLAAKLYYKMLSYKFENPIQDDDEEEMDNSFEKILKQKLENDED
jgi:agmatinase